MSAYLKVGQFDVARSFATWLFTIARRKCIDRHRASRPAAEERAIELVEEEDPATVLSRNEEGQGLWEVARRTLPKLQFQALWLRYAEDMSIAEIGRVVRKTQTHVKVLLFRARMVLGRELERHGLEEAPTRPVRFAGAKSPPRKQAHCEPVRLSGVVSS